MGREQKRREERNNRNITRKEEQIDVTIKPTTLIKIIIVIAIILLVLYYILAVFITKEIDVSSSNKNETTENNTTNNTNNKILARTIFNQSEDVYYVYFYNFSNEDENISTALNNKRDMTIYRVNTNDGLNSNFITEENGNKNVTSIDNLKVKDPTLIEITNDKVTKYFEGASEIINFLNN